MTSREVREFVKDALEGFSWEKTRVEETGVER